VFSSRSSKYNPNPLPSISQTQTIIDPSNNTVRPIALSNNTLPPLHSLINARPDLVNTRPVNSNNPPLIMECHRV